MKLSQFNYNCPSELIAQKPAEERESSRLLVYKQNGAISDHIFNELPHVLNNIFKLQESKKKLLLIGNNSKVYPARVKAYRKTGARCEVFILELGTKETYKCLIRPKSKLKENEVLYLDKHAKTPIFQIVNLYTSTIKPLFSEPIEKFLEKHGRTPLPPYIKRNIDDYHQIDETDKTRYQNLYAHEKLIGSAAAPTAGLHFSEDILQDLSSYNIELSHITLHVGLGTFLPVKSSHISEHTMHEEHYCMPSKTIQKIFHFLKNDWPIVYIGTTSLRSTESFFRKLQEDIHLKKDHIYDYKTDAEGLAGQWISTNLFLYPKTETEQTKPIIGNGLITNFHQPESSLLMLVASIVGFHQLNKIYAHALKEKYRFFSYGDSSFLTF